MQDFLMKDVVFELKDKQRIVIQIFIEKYKDNVLINILIKQEVKILEAQEIISNILKDVAHFEKSENWKRLIMECSYVPSYNISLKDNDKNLSSTMRVELEYLPKVKVEGKALEKILDKWIEAAFAGYSEATKEDSLLGATIVGGLLWVACWLVWNSY